MTDIRKNQEEMTRGRVIEIANRLRKMADEIEERSTRRYVSLHGHTDLGKLAADTIGTIAWGLANMGLDRLASLAAEADALSRQPTEVR